MADPIKYLVKVDGDSAHLAVIGRACYLNCRSVGDFFHSLIQRECKKVSINFAKCTGMDSTFLGMIAGLALKLRKNGGEVALINLNERNRKLVQNLGIYRLVNIGTSSGEDAGDELLAQNATGENILSAHQNLVEADPSNASKFEDVISYLKKDADLKP